MHSFCNSSLAVGKTIIGTQNLVSDSALAKLHLEKQRQNCRRNNQHMKMCTTAWYDLTYQVDRLQKRMTFLETSEAETWVG